MSERVQHHEAERESLPTPSQLSARALRRVLLMRCNNKPRIRWQDRLPEEAVQDLNNERPDYFLGPIYRGDGSPDEALKFHASVKVAVDNLRATHPEMTAFNIMMRVPRGSHP